MNDEETAAVERQPPEAAFGLLSNDLRVAMLRALGEGDGAVSFSELRERVGAPDSGKFNYHLGKLTGNFVTRDDDGYALSLAGQRVYGAILSGQYTADATVAPFEFEGPCPNCGHDALVAAYADEKAKLYCPDCGVWRNEFSFPPPSLDQFARADLPSAFDSWMRATVLKVLQGFCANCGGRIEGRLEPTDDDSPMALTAQFECGRCGDELRSSPTLPVVFHPVAISYFESHGVDVFDDPSWRFFGRGQEIEVTMSEEDEPTATVRIALGDDELTATVSSDLSVADVRVG